MNERIRKAAQSGAFEPFMEVMQQIVNRQEDFDFDSDPYKNAYNLGKRDLARNFLAEIETEIKANCQ